MKQGGCLVNAINMFFKPYPFNVTFGYQEANHEKFLCDLKMIKPLINETFDFEKCIIERRGLNPGKLQTSGPYNFLRRTMQNYWHILNEQNLSKYAKALD